MRKIMLGLVPVLIGMSGGAMAAVPNWKVSEVSGDVRITQNGHSRAAVKGALLSSGAMIATGDHARAIIVRGEEFVVVSPHSQLRVPEAKAETSIVQMIEDFGTALFKIEKKSTPHFGVQTPYLAAVVKGTTFTVTVGGEGASVQVTEGRVAVATLDGGASQLVTPGVIAMVSAQDIYRLNIQGDVSKVIRSPNAPAEGKTSEGAPSASYSGPPSKVVEVAAPVGEEPQPLTDATGGLVNGDPAVKVAMAEFADQAHEAKKDKDDHPGQPNPGPGPVPGTDPGGSAGNGHDGNKPGKGDDAGKPGKGDDAGKPGKGDDAGKPGKGDDAGKPGKGDDAGKPGKGDDAGKPGKGDDAGKPGKGDDAGKPGKGDDAGKPGKGDDAGKPGKGDDKPKPGDKGDMPPPPPPGDDHDKPKPGDKGDMPPPPPPGDDHDKPKPGDKGDMPPPPPPGDDHDKPKPGDKGDMPPPPPPGDDHDKPKPGDKGDVPPPPPVDDHAPKPGDDDHADRPGGDHGDGDHADGPGDDHGDKPAPGDHGDMPPPPPPPDKPGRDR